MRLAIATRNLNKTKEIKEICNGMHIDFVTLSEFPSVPPIIEDGLSFRENAFKKACVLAEYTGDISMGDDSGLEVDCLNGRPGVLSSRYAGEGANDEANNRKLLNELKEVPISKRGAVFRCTIALVGPGVEEVFEGECRGIIAVEPSGRNGFGYDPIFYLPTHGKTAAELTPDEKNKISHRAKALQGFVQWIKENKTDNG